MSEVRAGHGLVQGRSGRDGGKWSDSGHILKVEAAGFSDVPDVGREKKRRVKYDLRVWA